MDRISGETDTVDPYATEEVVSSLLGRFSCLGDSVEAGKWSEGCRGRGMV
jgi:hypothetical protein